MSFANFAEGFADGFIPTFTRRMEQQEQEDADLAKLQLQQRGSLYQSRAEADRAAREIQKQAQNLYQLTGTGDIGAYYQLLQTGMKPADIVKQVQENPNMFQSISGGASAATQTPFQQGVAIMNQFGGPTVEAGEALESARANTGGSSSQEIDLLARTIIGEAASEPVEGKIAVANVVMNRIGAGRFGGSMQDVLFAKNQFEPWTNPETRTRLMNIPTSSPQYQEAVQIATAVINGQVPDVTRGATHFANPDVVRQYNADGKATDSTLAWVQNVEQNGVRIGRHVFGNPDGAGAVSRNSGFSPTDAQMADSGLAPTYAAGTEQSAQPAENDNTLATLLGVNQAARDRDISARVDRLSEAAGFNAPTGGGFAGVPQSNFSLNLGGGEAVDISTYIGASATKLDQAFEYYADPNTPNLTPAQFDTLTNMRAAADSESRSVADDYLALLSGTNPKAQIPTARQRLEAAIESGAIPEDRVADVLRHFNAAVTDILDDAFERPKDTQDADFRFKAAQSSGDFSEADRLWSYTTAGQTGNSVQVVVNARSGGRGMVVNAIPELVEGTVVYRDAISGELLNPDEFAVRQITTEEYEQTTNLVSSPDVNSKLTDITDEATMLRQTATMGRALARVIGEDERVTTAGGRLALFLDNLGRDVDSVFSVLADLSGNSNNGVITEEQANAELRRRGILRDGETLESLAGGRTVEDIMGGGEGILRELATKTRELEAILTLGAFRIGAAEGQTGRNVSNLFFTNYLELLKGARDEGQVKARVTGLLERQRDNYLEKVAIFENDGRVRAFEQRYNYVPQMGARIEDFLQLSPDFADALSYFGIQVGAEAPAERTVTKRLRLVDGVLVEVTD
jgi:spore germination cell wall hydrolase CwlJ-like protein